MVTMAKCVSTSVTIKGLSDKWNITLTFTITLTGDFLPLQINYAGKTPKSQSRDFKFPTGFLVTQNLKHWSNEEETINLINNIINSYVVKKCQKLKLPVTQKALVIWDVFKGQVTDTVIELLESLNIQFVPVPANMTRFFQTLDLTVNKSAKQFMWNEIITYYSNIVRERLDNGKSVEDIEVDLRLTTIKPLHAK